MSKHTGFRIKDCSSPPFLCWKFFNALRLKDDEPIYTYTDKYMRHSVRQTKKQG